MKNVKTLIKSLEKTIKMYYNIVVKNWETKIKIYGGF